MFSQRQSEGLRKKTEIMQKENFGNYIDIYGVIGLCHRLCQEGWQSHASAK